MGTICSSYETVKNGVFEIRSRMTHNSVDRFNRILIPRLLFHFSKDNSIKQITTHYNQTESSTFSKFGSLIKLKQKIFGCSLLYNNLIALGFGNSVKIYKFNFQKREIELLTTIKSRVVMIFLAPNGDIILLCDNHIETRCSFTFDLKREIKPNEELSNRLEKKLSINTKKKNSLGPKMTLFKGNTRMISKDHFVAGGVNGILFYEISPDGEITVTEKSINNTNEKVTSTSNNLAPSSLPHNSHDKIEMRVEVLNEDHIVITKSGKLFVYNFTDDKVLSAFELERKFRYENIIVILENDLFVVFSKFYFEFHVFSKESVLFKGSNVDKEWISSITDMEDNLFVVASVNYLQFWNSKTRSNVYSVKKHYSFVDNMFFSKRVYMFYYDFFKDSEINTLRNCEVDEYFEFRFVKKKKLKVHLSVVQQCNYFKTLMHKNERYVQCKDGDYNAIKEIIEWLYALKPNLKHEYENIKRLAKEYKMYELSYFCIVEGKRCGFFSFQEYRKCVKEFENEHDVFLFSFNRKKFLRNSISTLLNDEVSSNIVLAAGDVEYMCHREILSFRSAFFHGMLRKGSFLEGEQDRIELNCDEDVFESIIGYVYNYKLKRNNSIDDLFKLFVVSDKFQMESLNEYVKEQLKNIKQYKVEELIKYIIELHQKMEASSSDSYSQKKKIEELMGVINKKFEKKNLKN